MDGSGGDGAGRDERAVSNVVAVILLVAITVTLAGLFTGFFLGFDEEVEEPSPAFTATTEYDNTMADDGETLVIKHEGGADVDPEYLTVVVQNARWKDTASGSSGDAEYVGDAFGAQMTGNFSAANELALNRTHFEKEGGGALTGDTYLDLSDATVFVRWEDPSPDTDRTDLLYRCDVEFPNCAGL